MPYRPYLVVIVSIFATLLVGCGSADDDGGACDCDSSSSCVNATCPDAAVDSGGPVLDADAQDGAAQDAGEDADASPGFDGQSCEMPSLVTLENNAATIEAATTTGYGNLYGHGAGCPGTDGEEHVYAVDVPAYHWMAATVTGRDGFDPSVQIGDAAACTNEGRVCLAGDDAGTAETQNSARFPNNHNETRRYYVFVDSSSTTRPGSFDVSITTEAFTPGDTCEVALELPLDGRIAQGTTKGLAHIYDLGAPFPPGLINGSDVVYRVDLPPQSIADVWIHGAPDHDPAAFIASLEGCQTSPATPLDATDNRGHDSIEYLAFSNDSDAVLTRYLVVSSSEVASGDFFIKGAQRPIAEGETCKNAFMGVIDAAPVSANLDFAVNDHVFGDDACRISFSNMHPGPEHAYRYTIPAGSAVEFEVTPTGFDVALSTLKPDKCTTSLTCLDAANSFNTRGTERLRHANTGASDEDITLLVRGRGQADRGPYELRARSVPMTATPISPGNTCADAPLLPAGDYERISGTTVGLTDTVGGGGWCGSMGGPEGQYRLKVEPGEFVRTTLVSTDSSFSPLLALGLPASCDSAFYCLTWRNSRTWNFPRYSGYMNFWQTPQEILVLIDDVNSGARSGPFELTVRREMLPDVLQPGDTCETAPLLPVNTRIAGNTDRVGATYTGRAGQSCDVDGVHSAHTQDGVYRVEVPAGKTFVARAESLRHDVHMWIVRGGVEACNASPLVCAASASGATSTEELRWSNPGTETETVFLIIGNDYNIYGDAFILETRLEDTPAGDTCRKPQVIEGTHYLSFDSMATYSSSMHASCGDVPHKGRDRVYQVTVPDGHTVSAVAQYPHFYTSPSPYGDASVYIIDGDVANCTRIPTTLTCREDRGDYHPERAEWLNDSGAEKTVFVVLDTDIDTNGAFLVDIQVEATANVP